MSFSAKSAVKSVTNAVKEGVAVVALQDIQKWTDGVDVPLPNWDIHVGAALWGRCLEKDVLIGEVETKALEEIYSCLVRTFKEKSEDKEHYLERVKVFAASLKFFVKKNRLNLEVLEELLQEISKTSFHVRQHNYAAFRTVCLNFYAYIWNYMRDNHEKFNLHDSLAHSSLSVRWLVPLGLEQFQNISHKLAQISMLLMKNHANANETISDFFVNLSTKIVDTLKQVVMDDANNGVKVKKKKGLLPPSHFHGILNITFVLARQLVIFGDFERAFKVFRPITSIAQVYFDPELKKIWKSALEAYVRICMIVANNTGYLKPTDDILNASEAFREVRKQILDLEFQKTYPGYAFSFMYAFTESIGSVINSSKVCATSLLRKLPIKTCAKVLKEIQFAADACVALDDMESGKHTLDGVTENRKVEVYSAALFHILKIASDRISDKESDGKELYQVTEAAFSTLMTLANRIDLEASKSAELFSIITYHTCNLGYAYQKRKCFKEAMSWCYRSVDAYEAYKSKNVPIDLKINALSIGLLLADCHRQLESYTEGLRWLSKWLLIAPQFLECQSPAYDIYEQIPWTDWSVHWQALQKELCAQDPEQCRSIIEYLEEEDPGAVTDQFASKALRLEVNSYFSGRQTIVPAILNIGCQLDLKGYTVADKVLGCVAQAVGLWWMGTEESLTLAAECLERAVGLLDSGRASEEEKLDAVLITYLTGVVVGWKALCLMKMNQVVAQDELNRLKEKVLLENPSKSKDRGDTLFAVPAFSSLTLEDERRFAKSFCEAAECFYQSCQMEDVYKSVTSSYCPALAQITVRLVALGLSALGEKVYAAKAWFATFVTAKLYDRKGVLVLAASEVLKVLPNPSLECVKYAEKVNEGAKEGKLIKHNHAVYYRLDLAKAYACYQQKDYKEGLGHLAKVYKFLAQKDNFDSTHHLMAEANYVLSLYRSVALSRRLDFPAGIPQLLCKMTPAGLTVKGHKLLGGLSRETDVLSSGWTDLLHNYYLLGSIAEVSARTVKLLKETGKLRDLKCFITDAIYFYQRLGIVSRSVAMLVPLIETDISYRNFYMAQIRIAAITKVMLGSDPKEEENLPPLSEAKKFLQSQLKIPGLSMSRLENVSNLKWHLGDIDAVPFHYRNRSEKYLSPLKADCQAINIKSMEMKAPSILRHPLTCFCYTCSHPEIIPSVLEFLTVQAKYAVAMKWKISMAVLELTRLHHQRAMFRVLFNMEYVTEQWQPIVTRKNGAKIYHGIYTGFFFTPGVQMQLANMEICPVADISHIVHLMSSTLKATDIVDSEDLALKVLPLEIGTCALYEYLVTGGRIPVLGEDIRERIRSAYVDQQEKENTILVPSSPPDVFEATIPPSGPPAVRKRGGIAPPLTRQLCHGRKATVTSLKPRRILNSKMQQQHSEFTATVELIDLTKVDDLSEDRYIPVVPGPNFDDSNDD